MKTPQPIPYQGSKRALAPIILSYFPARTERLIEPFAGSAAVSIAAAIKNKAHKIIINDINAPLIELIKEMVNEPDRLALNYEKLWNEQLGQEKAFFMKMRDLFNQTQRSDLFLYLLARCVKGSVRYNAQGAFNQSADNRRKGKHPESMKKEIHQVSGYLKGKTEFYAGDYAEILSIAQPGDLVYMDPPYQGTSQHKDPRYFSGLVFDSFVANLEALNKRHIPYMISYDGKTGEKTYGNDLPVHLGLHKIMLEAGRSSQATLLGKEEVTYEALYLSQALVNKLNGKLPEAIALKSKQLKLGLHE